ncbi:hypothetical protein [Paraburkholderia fungorum]|uniref:DUF2127 domain-containing protein n=1 Tax=Paraburkholderia fungorum TaxID=134537 RepID=A0AAW3UQE4_9BURK|nr:hypothetical protein [Paraburkholderia fungorum]MBB4512482.1 hypothetical protein [Paraburkholderia fungorum]MBB6200388.1 hypothetical protein [Paraburkholderia fungorum]
MDAPCIFESSQSIWKDWPIASTHNGFNRRGREKSTRGRGAAFLAVCSAPMPEFTGATTMRYLDNSTHDISGSNARLQRDADGLDLPDWRATALAPAEPAVLGRWTRWVVIATAVWSVIELPFEIWVSTSARNALACVTAKLLWVALVAFVLAGNRVARIAFAVLCTIGLMAVAFGLPAEYRMFPVGFVLSSAECVLKATAFVCLVSAGIYPDEA